MPRATVTGGVGAAFEVVRGAGAAVLVAAVEVTVVVTTGAGVEVTGVALVLAGVAVSDALAAAPVSPPDVQAASTAAPAQAALHAAMREPRRTATRRRAGGGTRPPSHAAGSEPQEARPVTLGRVVPGSSGPAVRPLPEQQKGPT